MNESNKNMPEGQEEAIVRKRNTNKWPINILKMLKLTHNLKEKKKRKERKSKPHYAIFKLSNQKKKKN